MCSGEQGARIGGTWIGGTYGHFREVTIPERRQPRKIRYTTAEWASIVQRARASRRPPARYVRETSLGAAPKTGHNRQNDDLIHELGRIGTTLSRLASQAKESAVLSEQATIETTLAELLAAVRRLA